MRFLVEITVDLPAELRDPQSTRRTELLAAELARGVELRRARTIETIWRVPGELRNVGIWNAADATALHKALTSLPLSPWMRTEVTALAHHPVELEVAR